jgi:hypothetical protein
MCPAELQRQRNPWSIRMIPPNLCVLLRGSSGKDDQTRPSINFSYCTIFLTCPFLFWGDLFWFSICFFFFFFTLLTVNVNQFGSKKRVTTLEAQSKEAPSEARVSNTVRLSLHLTAVKILRKTIILNKFYEKKKKIFKLVFTVKGSDTGHFEFPLLVLADNVADV